MDSRIKFIGLLELEAETPLVIVGGRFGNLLRTLRLPSGELLIPSSTWKGVFRRLAETLASTLQTEKNLASTPSVDPEHFRETLKRIGYSEEEINTEELRDELLKKYFEYHDPIGKLFGNQVRAGSLRFLDTVFKADTIIKAGIGIDRETDTVAENALYMLEAIPPGTRLRLIVIGELDAPGDPASTLLAGMLEYAADLGVNIGARKSVGYGLLRLVEEKCRFYIIKYAEDTTHGEVLANPFEKLKPLGLKEFVQNITRG